MDLHDVAERILTVLSSYRPVRRKAAWEALMEERATGVSPATRIALLHVANVCPGFAVLVKETRTRLLTSGSIEVRLAAIRSLAPRPYRLPEPVTASYQRSDSPPLQVLDRTQLRLTAQVVRGEEPCPGESA